MSVCLMSVCLSVAYIGPKSRPRKIKIGTEIVLVTCDSDTTFKVKRSRSPGRFTQRGLNAAAVSVGTYSAWESSSALRLLGGARGAWAPTVGGEGRGILRVAKRTACYNCLYSAAANIPDPDPDQHQNRIVCNLWDVPTVKK